MLGGPLVGSILTDHIGLFLTMVIFGGVVALFSPVLVGAHLFSLDSYEAAKREASQSAQPAARDPSLSSPEPAKTDDAGFSPIADYGGDQACVVAESEDFVQPAPVSSPQQESEPLLT
jgi:hypothetical protein